MAKLRGTKSGQRGIEYLLRPAAFILSQRPTDVDLDKAIQLLRYYVDNKELGRGWRSAAEHKQERFTGPDGVDYVYDRVFFRNEEALKECAILLIARIFGVDYNNLPDISPTAPFQPPPGAAGFQFGLGGFGGFAYPNALVPPPAFSYGPKMPSYVNKLDLRAPFNETVSYEQRKALAAYLGMSVAEMVKAWEAIEKDFDLPEAPYNLETL